MIDTHSHLNFKTFSQNYDKVLCRSFDHGITKIINIGSQLATSAKAIEIAEKYKECFVAVGIHPIHAGEVNSGWEKELIKMVKNKKVVAIGETGLDYYRIRNKQEKEIQKAIFLEHLKISQKFNLPLILHCRNAFEDLFNILKSHSSIQGVLHCFTGAKKDAKIFLDLGLYLGFTGLVTFVKDLEEAVKFAPLDKILLETDCPYLAPEPFRGQKCEPWMVRFTAEKVVKIKEICLDKIVEQTDKNAEKLFCF